MDAENKGGFICVRCQKEHSTAAQSCLGHTSPLALPSCSFLGRACCGQHGGFLSVASWPFSPPSLLVVSPGLPQPLEGGGTTQLVNSPGPDCVCPICKPRPCSPGRCPPPPPCTLVRSVCSVKLTMGTCYCAPGAPLPSHSR